MLSPSLNGNDALVSNNGTEAEEGTLVAASREVEQDVSIS